MALNLLKDGGPLFPLICLAGIAALAIFAERIIRLRQASIRYQDFLSGVFNILEKGKISEATALCDDSPGPVVKLMRAAIVHRDEPREALRQILENTGRAEIARMERRLAALSTITQATVSSAASSASWRRFSSCAANCRLSKRWTSRAASSARS